jgi:phenylacetate-CoA ligase
VLGALRGAGAESGRFVVGREGDKDWLRLELVASSGADRAALVEAAVEQTRAALRVRPDVELVEAVDEGLLVDERDWS